MKAVKPSTDRPSVVSSIFNNKVAKLKPNQTVVVSVNSNTSRSGNIVESKTLHVIDKGDLKKSLSQGFIFDAGIEKEIRTATKVAVLKDTKYKAKTITGQYTELTQKELLIQESNRELMSEVMGADSSTVPLIKDKYTKSEKKHRSIDYAQSRLAEKASRGRVPLPDHKETTRTRNLVLAQTSRAKELRREDRIRQQAEEDARDYEAQASAQHSAGKSRTRGDNVDKEAQRAHNAKKIANKKLRASFKESRDARKDRRSDAKEFKKQVMQLAFGSQVITVPRYESLGTFIHTIEGFYTHLGRPITSKTVPGDLSSSHFLRLEESHPLLGGGVYDLSDDDESKSEIQFEVNSDDGYDPRLYETNCSRLFPDDFVSEELDRLEGEKSQSSIAGAVEFIKKCVVDMLGSGELVDSAISSTVDTAMIISGSIYHLLRFPDDSFSCYFAMYPVVRLFTNSQVTSMGFAAGYATTQKLYRALRPKRSTIHLQGINSSILDVVDKGVDAYENGINSVTDLLDNDVFETFRDLVIAAAVGHMFPVGVGHLVIKNFGEFKRPRTRFEIFKTILECSKKMLIWYKNWRKTGDLFGNTSTRTQHDNAVRVLRDILQHGDAISYDYDPNLRSAQSILADGADAIVIVESYLSGLPAKKAAEHSSRKLVADARSRLEPIRATLNAVPRPPPVMVLISGPPGVGKSRVMDINAVCAMAAAGVNYTPSNNYHVVMSSDYLEGFNPDLHLIMHYSEFGQETADIQKKALDPKRKEILSIVDGQPFIANTAFADKGTVRVRPLMVMLDSNDDTAGFQYSHTYIGAIMRRIVRIKVHVKDYARCASSQMIDLTKTAAMTPAQKRDIWDFTVETFAETLGGKGFIPSSSVNLSSFDDFVKYMVPMYRRHFVSQRVTAAAFSHKDLVDEVNAIVQPMGFPAANFKPVVPNDKPPVQPAPQLRFNPRPIPKQPPYVVTQSGPIAEIYSSLHVVEEQGSVPVSPLDVEEPRTRWEAFGEVCSGLASTCTYHIRAVPSAFFSMVYFLSGSIPQKYRTHGLTLGVAGSSTLLTVASLFYSIPVSILFASVVGVATATNTTIHIPRPTCFVKAYESCSSAANMAKVGRPPVGKEDEALTLSRIEFWLRIVGFVVAAFAILTTLQWLMSGPKKPKSQNGPSKEKVPHQKVREFDEVIGAEDNLSGLRGNNCATFNITQPKFKPISNGTLAQLAQSTFKSVRRVGTQGISPAVSSCHIFGVSGDVALFTSHICEGVGPKPVIQIECMGRGLLSGNTKDVMLGKVNTYNVNDDLMFVKCVGITPFSDAGKHFMPPGVDTASHAYIDGELTSAISVPDPLGKHDGMVWRYNYAKEAKGKCGLPLYIQVHGGVFIAGIHYAGGEGVGYAFKVDRTMVEKAKKYFESSSFVPIAPFPRLDTMPLTYSVTEQGGPVLEHGPVSGKHHFSYEDRPQLEILGSIPGKVTLPKHSDVVRTQFEKHFPGGVKSLLEETLHVPLVKTFAPPLMKPEPVADGSTWVPYGPITAAMNKKHKAVDMDLIHDVVNCRIDHFVKELKYRYPTYQLAPIPVEKALSGIPGDPYFRSINGSTSGGPGFPGLKRSYFSIDEDGKYGLGPELYSCLLNSIDLSSEDLSIPSFCAMFLKDEPRPIQKVIAGLTRPVQNGSLGNILLDRVALGCLVTLHPSDGDMYGSAIGVDMHREAYKVYHLYSRTHPHPLFFDYKFFDLSMHFAVTYGVASVRYGMCKRLGYPEHGLPLLRSILSGQCYPIVRMCGVDFISPGTTISGEYGTAEKNSEKNDFITHVAWAVLKPDSYTLEDYFTHYHKALYGDDGAGFTTKEVHSWFNGPALSRVVKDIFDMDLTDPNKSPTMPMDFPTHNMEFLKRVPQWSFTLGYPIAPLDLESINRSLMWCLPSMGQSPSDQLKDTVSSALRELFFHCDEYEYGRIRYRLMEMFNYIYPSMLESLEKSWPTFDELFTTFEESAQNYRVRVDSDTQASFDWIEWSRLCSSLTIPNGPLSIVYLRRLGRKVGANVNDILYELQDEAKALAQELSQLPRPLGTSTYNQAMRHPSYSCDPEFREAADNYYRVHSKLESAQITIEFLERHLPINGGVGLQSGPAVEIPVGDADSDSRIVSENFIDQTGDAMPCSDAVIPAYNPVPDTHFDIDSFFERPVYIGSVTWAPGTLLSTLSVSDIYFTDPAVKAKYKNYAWIRGDFVIDISVSGNPMMLGCAIGAPIYWEAECNSITAIKNAMLSNSNATIYEWARWIANNPNAMEIDVNRNSVLRYKVPWCAPLNAFRLFANSTSALAAGTVPSDAAGYITFEMASINNLTSVSATATNASITVYAHMENVQLGMATGSVMAITTQSGPSAERVVGPVEKVLLRTVDVANELTNAPIIGPWATATSMAGTIAARIAAILGLSYPVQSTSEVVPKRVKPMAYQNSANIIGTGTDFRLTLSPNQEVGIDATALGRNTDDMVVAHLAQQECLLYSFTWAVATTPMGSSIFQMALNPRAKVSKLSGTAQYVQPTWQDFLACIAHYWRYDYEVIRLSAKASALHKGKLAVWYEPNTCHTSLVTAAGVTNKQCIAVWDISQTTDLEVTIPWAFPRPWARVGTQTDASLMMGSTFVANVNMFETTNGMIYIIPLTELQSPNTVGVYVNVWHKYVGFSLNSPDGSNIPTKRVLYQSGPCCETYKGADEPERVELTTPGFSSAGSCQYTFGEQIVSVRGLLHRYESRPVQTIATDAGTGYKSMYVNQPIYLAPAVFGSTGTDSTLLTYLRGAFLGMRGGTKFRVRAVGHVAPPGAVCVTNLQGPTTSYAAASTSIGSTPQPCYLVGSVQTNVNTSGGVEFEAPYYTSNLFAWAQSADPYANAGSSTCMQPEAVRNTTCCFDSFGANLTVQAITDYATADDFSLLRPLSPFPYSL